MYLDVLKVRVQEEHLLGRNRTFPCSEEDIQELEDFLHVTFPAAYREFLLWMGHGAGKTFDYAHCYYWHLEGNQEMAQEMLMEDKFPAPLPENALVFYIYLAETFYFFRIDEGDDPPVYKYREFMKETSFPRVSDTYSAWLATEIENHAAAVKRLEPYRDRLRSAGISID